ncbi:MAG: segregation and condensation protein A [Eubacteriaceae bacterium]
MSYAISLESFEGPLDLLLHLIQKNKIDICDISISEITSQYLGQIGIWKRQDMEIASDFIVMAARLLELKSKMLLPKNEGELEEDEEALKTKLLRQIYEYKIFKEISAYLGKREERELRGIYKDPEYIPEEIKEETIEIDPLSLLQSFKTLLLREEEVYDILPPQKIVRELFSVEEKIEKISNALKNAGEKGLSFSELLFPGISREEVVVTLLALLELVKTKGLRLKQNRVFIDFQIKKEEVHES